MFAANFRHLAKKSKDQIPSSTCLLQSPPKIKGTLKPKATRLSQEHVLRFILVREQPRHYQITSEYQT